MIIYLAGGETYYSALKDKIQEYKLSGGTYKINILSSFVGLRRNNFDIPPADRFILDSGAFSFIKHAKTINWDEYLEKYITFVKEKNIRQFIELDIGELVGYERVKDFRRRLEREINIQPIPVWHRYLGANEFLRMCDEYSYIALGGFAIKAILPSEYKFIPAFVSEAHKRGTKIHGLGFTRFTELKHCHFDSVDSSSWTYGTRYGQIYFFDQEKGCCWNKKVPKDKRALESVVPTHNFFEWVKCGHWAESHL